MYLIYVLIFFVLVLSYNHARFLSSQVAAENSAAENAATENSAAENTATENSTDAVEHNIIKDTEKAVGNYIFIC